MRVRRTFAFLDLSGFTALTATEGDERAVALVESFRSALRTTCSRRAVRIAKWLGDGAMLVAVDPTPVVCAALELQHHGGDAFALRCAITTGPVILLEGDDYIGHAVNVAARLCDLAPAGDVMAGPELVEALPPWATWEDCGTVAVRGVESPMTVVRLCLADPAAAPDPVCGLPVAVAPGLPVVNGMVFCSESCLDTWQNRPGADEEEWRRDGIA